MTKYELIKFSKELLEQLLAFDIKLKDCQYIDLYEDYIRLRKNGEKMTYVVAVLSNIYNICERKVYKIIKHFEEDCQISAVE